VSQDDPQTTGTDAEAERTRSDARGAELRAELAETDERRTEEQLSEAHEAVGHAQEREEKLSRKERKQHEAAERAEAEAQQARERAEAAAQARAEAHRGAVAGTGSEPAGSRPAATPSETPGAEPGLADRPEVLLGGAFVGTFVFARILKRLFD
jgi:hypothetical protein